MAGRTARRALIAGRIAALLLAAFLAQSSAWARQDVADFYKSHSLTLGVPNAAGGGYDIYLRALARRIADHIPGNPAVIVQRLADAKKVGIDIEPADHVETERLAATLFATSASVVERIESAINN
jgi:hypothetical protein